MRLQSPYPRPDRGNLRGFSLLELLVVIAITSVLLGLILGAVQYARESSRRVSCASNLRQLGVALRMTADTQKRLPFEDYSTSDAPGNISWRVVLLPMLEQKPLFATYAAKESWNSIKNQQLAERMPSIYSCSSRASISTSHASYDLTPPLFDGPRLDLTRLNSQTPVIAEVNDEHAEIWTKPYNDLMFPEVAPPPAETVDQLIDQLPAFGNRAFSGNHGSSFHVLFAGGQVVFVREVYDREKVRAALEGDGL